MCWGHLGEGERFRGRYNRHVVYMYETVKGQVKVDFFNYESGARINGICDLITEG